MYSEAEESETSELIMGVLRELKDIKEMLVNNTKQLQELQTTVEAMTGNTQPMGWDDRSFPIATFEDLEEVEEMMKDDDAREYLIMQMKSILKADDPRWLSKLLNEELIREFNITGQGGKRNMMHLEIIQFSLKYLKVDKSSLAFYVRRTKDKLNKRKRRFDDVPLESLEPKREKNQHSEEQDNQDEATQEEDTLQE